MKTREAINIKFDEITARIEAISFLPPSIETNNEWRELIGQMKIINWILYGI
jgi:hypothetical protein